jgi:hypothetical protein
MSEMLDNVFGLQQNLIKIFSSINEYVEAVDKRKGTEEKEEIVEGSNNYFMRGINTQLLN